MDGHPSIEKQLEEQQRALTQIYQSVEKTRKYMLWTAIGSLIVFVLPLIVLPLVLPGIISNFQASLGGLI
jgi:uncharacterized membrane protein YkvA (DUF1232 family)